MTLELTRRRALALDEAVRVIESEWGETVDFCGDDPIMSAPNVPHRETCEPIEAWEVVAILRELRDRYISQVLAPAERGTT